MNKLPFSPAQRKWGLIALFVLWIFAVSGVFYVTQKPVSPTDLPTLLQSSAQPFRFSAAALGRTALDLAAALWLWALAIGLGRWGIRGLVKDDPGSGTPDEVIFSAGLGFGGLGLIVFALGLAGLLNRTILFATTIFLSLIALPQLLHLVRRWRNRRPAQPTDRPSLPVKLYLLITLGLGLTIALLPPTDWDGLFYHLTGPKLYLAAGRISSGIDIPHLSFPGLFEMLFTLGISLRGDVTAKLLHFGFSLLLAALVYRLGTRHLRLKNGRLSILILFSIPMVLTLAGWAYNDLALAFFQVGALYTLLTWREEKQAARLILGGLFCGLSMSLKYTSIFAPVTLGGLLLWWLWRDRIRPAPAFKSALAFGLPAVLVALPWYLKNWLFTGNPVYPFVFGGAFWDEFRSAAYSGAGSGIGFDLVGLLTLPYQLTLGLHDANYIDGRTGPLFLAFLPLLLVYGVFRYRKKNFPPALDGLLVFALAQYAFWTFGVAWSAGLWQSRLLLPAFVALCPALAWMIDDLRYLNHRQFSLNHFLGLFIGIVLLLGLVDQLFNNQIGSKSGWLYYRPLHHLVGTETRTDYLTRRLGVHYAAMETLNTELPPDAVVLFLWEPRSYYCRLDCRPDSILDTYNHLQYLHGSDAEAIVQQWKTDGITHVLVFKLGLDFLLAEADVPPELRPDPALLNQLEAQFMEPTLDVFGAYQVYRLK